MNYWLMSLKWGNDGKCFFELFKRKGILATGWWNKNNESPGNLTNYSSKNDFKKEWGWNSSLWDFAFLMKKGDIVYIRGDINQTKSASIIGKGVISSDYCFSETLFDNEPEWIYDMKWQHYRYAEWKDFTPVFNKKIHNQITIYKMKDADIEYLKTIDPFFFEDLYSSKTDSGIDKVNKLKDGAAREGLYTYFERNPKNHLYWCGNVPQTVRRRSSRR